MAACQARRAISLAGMSAISLTGMSAISLTGRSARKTRCLYACMLACLHVCMRAGWQAGRLVSGAPANRPGAGGHAAVRMHKLARAATLTFTRAYVLVCTSMTSVTTATAMMTGYVATDETSTLQTCGTDATPMQRRVSMYTESRACNIDATCSMQHRYDIVETRITQTENPRSM